MPVVAADELRRQRPRARSPYRSLRQDTGLRHSPRRALKHSAVSTRHAPAMERAKKMLAAARSLTSVWLIGLPPLIGKIIEKSNGRQLDTQQLRPEQARH